MLQCLMSKLSILVVDDDPLARKILGNNLGDHAVDFAENSRSAIKKLATGGHDLCFIDLKLGEEGFSGLELIPAAKASGIYSVVMSSHAKEAFIDRAYALGCDDFYAKGNERENVGKILARCLTRRRNSNNGSVFKNEFITEDPETQNAVTEVLGLAGLEIPVLILGPSGSGKTRLAHLIHQHSRRAGQFVAVNCSTGPEELLEAELFGYHKGAFTGAVENRQGKLLLADQGTLFLDEIGAMSPKMQAKLLKAIEERAFYPLGSETPCFSRFRLLSATLENLQDLVKSGKMRFDFFQRIHGLTLDLKPLSHRKGDIFPLISFLTRKERKLSFSLEAKEKILGYDWPGNVRELAKFVELLSAKADGRVSAEAVGKIISSNLLEKAKSLIPDEHYRFALEHGLKKAAERFVDLVIARCLDENNGVKTKVLSDLKIATGLLYRSLLRRARPGSGRARPISERRRRATDREPTRRSEEN